jgi:hypothetical protein
VNASNGTYSDTYHINVGMQIYQLQALYRDEKTIFPLKLSGELLCTISVNEHDGWECDNDLTFEQLMEISQWITKLFYSQLGKYL